MNGKTLLKNFKRTDRDDVTSHLPGIKGPPRHYDVFGKVKTKVQGPFHVTLSRV